MSGVSAKPSSGHWKYASIAAAATSFLVYLIPMISPHGFWFFGGALWLELVRRHHEAAWIAADFGVALAAQALLGALCYPAFRRRPLLGAVAAAGAMVVIVPALSILYGVVIPAHFLIESSDEPEKTPWAQECVASGGSLAPLPASAAAALGAAGEALVRLSTGGYALLGVPGCALTPIPLPQSPGIDVVFAIPGGTVLAWEQIHGKQRFRHWIAADGKLEALDWLDKGPDASAVLSTDGTALAWLERNPSGQPPMAAELHIAARDGSSPRSVPLSKLALGSYTLLALDARVGQALLARNLDEFIILGEDGEIHWGPFRPPGVEPQPHTFVRFDQGWAAWDAYRERERYRLAWSLPAGAGSHAIPKGRAINSSAASPAGGYIAYSITGRYSIGNVPDFVAVVRASDGAEVFRKYLPRYTRSGVAFLGSERFAYSDLDGTHAVIRVLRMSR